MNKSSSVSLGRPINAVNPIDSTKDSDPPKIETWKQIFEEVCNLTRAVQLLQGLIIRLKDGATAEDQYIKQFSESKMSVPESFREWYSTMSVSIITTKNAVIDVTAVLSDLIENP